MFGDGSCRDVNCRVWHPDGGRPPVGYVHPPNGGTGAVTPTRPTWQRELAAARAHAGACLRKLGDAASAARCASEPGREQDIREHESAVRALYQELMQLGEEG